MIKNFNLKRILSAILLMVAIGTPAFSIPVNAIEGHALQISPTLQQMDLEPGEVYEGTFRVGNIGNEAFDYTLGVTPYQVANEEYEPDYVTENKYTQIANWIELSENKGNIAPSHTNEVHYKIKVPENVPAGGQYAMIYAESANNEEHMFKSNTRVGMLVYAHVAGETDTCAKIISNDINTFMFEPPIIAKSIVEDCGNIDFPATYTMKVYPLFSNEPIYTNEEKPGSSIILPETRHYHTIFWSKEDGAPMMGIFNVEQTVKIGKETSTVKKLVFIFPLWLLIVFILLIAAIIFWLVSRSRKRKEDSRRSNSSSDKPSRSDD